jgi:hypothetical protein
MQPLDAPAPSSGSTFSRTSTRVFAAGLALVVVALAVTWRQGSERRDFSGKTTITMGTVLRYGALFGKSRRAGGGSFCWVSYEFTPPGGALRRNWRLWEPACGLSRGRQIPILHRVDRPDVNRPAGEEWSFPTLLLWFAAGVTLVVAFVLRGSREDA